MSHSAAAITNFVEGMNGSMLKPYLEEILKKSFVLLQNGISIVKENAMSTIAATAEASKEDFHKYFADCMPILF